jgi:MOSC domain-containing protein YiiM
MKVVAVSVAEPRQVEWRGRTVETAIFKTPVAGRVRVGRLNLDGDRQADLSVHGGPEKAVYAYPAEHYAFWRTELPDADLAWGALGENLTTEGLVESEIGIGDRYEVGSAELVVTQPRMPCYKLGIRFGRADMVKRFLQSGRSGFYFAVAKEGDVGAGDAIRLVARDERRLAVAEQALLERASEHPGLPAGWRDYFRQRLWEPDA